MAIRSGRFTINGASIATPIIRGRSGAPYRIYNSGDLPFKVDVGNGSAIALPKACSRDIVVDGTVVVNSDTSRSIAGIYDYLGPQNPVRSGRFKGDVSETGITIIQGGYGRIYRIFNSGDKRFVVDGGGKEPTLLKPTFSLDVVVNSDVEIKVPDPEASTKRNDSEKVVVEGIYD